MTDKRINALVMRELEKADDWELVQGTAHIKIKIGGRLAGIVPLKRNDAVSRAAKNVVSQIRSARREQEQNQ